GGMVAVPRPACFSAAAGVGAARGSAAADSAVRLEACRSPTPSLSAAGSSGLIFSVGVRITLSTGCSPRTRPSPTSGASPTGSPGLGLAGSFFFERLRAAGQQHGNLRAQLAGRQLPTQALQFLFEGGDALLLRRSGLARSAR